MSKIGIFDSGIGGLSVFKVIYANFPNCDYIYLADEGYYPYGIKTKEEIVERSFKIVKFLSQKNVDLIVVACNTVSSVALSYLKENFKTPIVGVIDGAILKSIKITKNKKIGVIATPLTASSHVYKNKILDLDKDIEVCEIGSQELVNIVENGVKIDNPIYKLIEKTLNPLKNCDTLILGCTHFPALEEVIKKVLKNVNIVDPAKEIVPFIKSYLNCTGNGERFFYTTLDKKSFKEKAKIFLQNLYIEVSEVNI
ncbi:MAG: glutamate racemase [Caldisericia bacterium]|nr:glutamate racemase [Caldisericia bacterium]